MRLKKDKQINSFISQKEEVMTDFRSVFSEI